MRIAPNHPRLRAVALACWIVGGWWIIQVGLLKPALFSSTMVILMCLMGVLLLTLGVAFWALGGDRRAGVVFDSKGLLLNLGHSAAFVAWDNIERMGTSSSRNNWLAIGSSHMVGIRLKDPAPYLQSYEARLPATRGPIGQALRLLQGVLNQFGEQQHTLPTLAQLARTRARTGYDILIPETLLGGAAPAFVALTEDYRRTLRRA